MDTLNRTLSEVNSGIEAFRAAGAAFPHNEIERFETILVPRLEEIVRFDLAHCWHATRQGVVNEASTTLLGRILKGQGPTCLSGEDLLQLVRSAYYRLTRQPAFDASDSLSGQHRLDPGDGLGPCNRLDVLFQRFFVNRLHIVRSVAFAL